MLVSICLPVYNGAKYLEEAINSVLVQSHMELELLIADDCSTDYSWQIIQNYAAIDSRVKSIRNDERLGLFSNYNRTIGSARGEYIKLFAQDDLMLPTAVATMAGALSTNLTAAMVACGKSASPDADSNEGSDVSVDASGQENLENVAKSMDLHNLAYSDANAEALHSVVHGTMISDEKHMEGLARGLNPGKLVMLKCLAQYRNLIGEPVAVMFRRELEEQFSRDYRSIGDLELWFRLLSKGDLFYIPEPLVTFREHAESRTSELLRDIDWVLDFPRLSRDYSQYLALLGIDRTSYCTRFLELAAPLVRDYSNTDSFFVDSLPPYKELAYYLLRRFPAALDGESNYRSVLKSTSWKVTKPLRMFKKKLKNN
jgi:glycosyltransferase involved in cell wall biosynthesis